MNTVWRVTAPTSRAPGSFYIFLADGTLVMTSCVETYRLATWQRADEDTLTIIEDRATQYDADVAQPNDRELRLRLKLVSETVDLTLMRAAVPYVCPDLRR